METLEDWARQDVLYLDQAPEGARRRSSIARVSSPPQLGHRKISLLEVRALSISLVAIGQALQRGQCVRTSSAEMTIAVSSKQNPAANPRTGRLSGRSIKATPIRGPLQV
jgi:hypothetical protein